MTIWSYPIRIFRFYRDGFAAMTVGRTLWKLIFIKLFIMFAVLKVFFFPDFLTTRFDTDEQRAGYVLEQITNGAANQDERRNSHGRD
ncbi:DUF4492 domain-containing protein [Desulfofustis glycolicus]|uniref:DUF4492 domain-containing protein n=1 Tax=Desulfofustis glycolicus DSM 9705 TaxID=1121409 RepID=A0A1M5WRF5_9BACT|nr:DUF4492 domain-containing protein [Desulfofustis glycolicus]MCB2218331.1 DUF4492 domain-containing protein [Desulfobulbaceae bacterium]SHH90021.1 protein of unknown function [Desulfofustis glycolicus DSM 9705]